MVNLKEDFILLNLVIVILYFIFELMIKQINNFLNQPYPDSDDFKSMLIGSISTGVIVFLVLALLKPFGLSEVGIKSFHYAAIFGGVTTVTCLIVELFFKYIVGIERDVPEWTFWKWILSILFLLMMITLANYLCSSYLFGYREGGFFSMLYRTFIVGIVPVTIFGSIHMLKKTRINQKIAAEVNYKSENVSASANVKLPIKNSAKIFEVDPNKVLFLQSLQNYVLIHYLDENQELRKETHRNTITALEEILLESGIKRTHRSYLVNPKMIEEISGNAQGLKLALNGTDLIVPVSRKYISQFRNK